MIATFVMHFKVEIIKNQHYNSDVKYAIQLIRLLLYFSACWPVNKKNNCLLLQLFVRFVKSIIILMMAGLVLPMLLSPLFSNQDQSQSVKDFTMIIVCGGNMIKYIIIASNNKRIEACIKQIQYDWCYIFSESRTIMLKYAKFNREFITALMVMSIIIALSWIIGAFIKEPVVVDNITIHYLPYPAYYVIFDGRIEPYFRYVQMFQFFSNFIVLPSIMITCIVITYMSHVFGQYDILANIVNKFGNNNWISNVNIHLEYILKKHYFLIR